MSIRTILPDEKLWAHRNWARACALLASTRRVVEKCGVPTEWIVMLVAIEPVAPGGSVLVEVSVGWKECAHAQRIDERLLAQMTDEKKVEYLIRIVEHCCQCVLSAVMLAERERAS